ncbi:fumarylacetoacetate hydrolase family protein [Leucobacter sp. cx-328]|uniref:fumarylacetoacetate hydrolase family protein n=1 Tax=unclassified Leucobacter TaxID=2621730 RepID=UPI00165D859C|nr:MULTISPECIES: fumarylacetoacetate hydrolase family protein [unclassified Leucobacter]MBC9942962.1 fumarylacetoacetate hydrolase family protein [Leucobacter sp. cx-328]MBC9953528.1 fumarylacetoacetate hydrolase family protein [Leucobacter sp. cx-42]
MKLVSYIHTSGTRGGVLIGSTVHDLERLLASSDAADRGAPSSVKEFLLVYGDRLSEFGDALVSASANELSTRVGLISEVGLLGPVTDPAKVLCVGLNYKDHVAETGRALPKFPDIFTKFASTLIGAFDEIRGAEISDNLDFEGEVAVVIGRKASMVSEDDALDYVAGLAPLNDVTARDLQYRGTQWTAGKAVDGSTPWGPALVTLDEIGDPQTLELVTRVNDVEMQRSNTSHQIFPIATIISYLSSFLTLEPGDVIATGTPQGIGAKRTPPVWITPGDTVEIEIERVGTLRNRVASV